MITVLLLVSGFISSAQQVKVKQPKGGAAGTWRLPGTAQTRFVADHGVIVIAGPYDFFES